MENKKVLLSVKDLHVKFRVRGRILTAIRGISLDFYENESVAIVGESGSGKSVFTKTFAGMLDSNGFIDQGSIIFNDDDLSDTNVHFGKIGKRLVEDTVSSLNKYSKLEAGAETYRAMEALKKERADREGLSAEETQNISEKISELRFQRTELFNRRQTIDASNEKELYRQVGNEIAALDAKIKQLQKDEEAAIKAHKKSAKADASYKAQYDEKMARLKERYEKEISAEISDEVKARNEVLGKEIYLSVGRYGLNKRVQYINKLCKCLKVAMTVGADLTDDEQLNQIFDQVVFRVKYLDETPEKLHGHCVVNLAKVKYSKDWNQIRGGKIATVFQDPMTSLNPIITIGKQITSVILKHQDCSETEARARALTLMKKVGIPNAENRFDDYPFQYSGGMRQRIVIAIALSCQPKILICDEPTTALDVTIQAQILKLIKDLQKEFGYTIVFITHDLGVVANVADREIGRAHV